MLAKGHRQGRWSTAGLPAVCVTILARGEPGLPAEHLREVALVTKAQTCGNLCDALLVGCQEVLGCLDALAREIGAQGLSGDNVVCSKEDAGKPYEAYLLDPSLLVAAPLPQLFLVTSEEDLIRKDSLKLDGLLTAAATEHELLGFPKGGERELIHVFSVSVVLC